MSPTLKLVAVVRQPAAAPVAATPPDVPGLQRRVLHIPIDEPGNEPSVVAVWMLWVADPVAALAALEVASDVYLVDERVQWLPDRTWPAGQPTPGVKRLSFVRAADGLSRDAFGAHWRDTHAPLARTHHPTLWRYVQNVVVEALTPSSWPIDGIAELSFLTVEDMHDRMYDSSEGRQTITADVRRFIDVAAGWRVLVTEHVLAVSNSNAF